MAVVALLFLSFAIGRHYPVQPPQPEIKRDTITLYHTDTITRLKPVYLESRIIDTITVSIHDTIRYSLPIEQRIYEDSTYRAVVSGYRPSLDEIQVYQKTITNTITETVTQYKRAKGWGIGFAAGASAGYYYTPSGWQPGAGGGITVGVTYTF